MLPLALCVISDVKDFICRLDAGVKIVAKTMWQWLLEFKTASRNHDGHIVAYNYEK